MKQKNLRRLKNYFQRPDTQVKSAFYLPLLFFFITEVAALISLLKHFIIANPLDCSNPAAAAHFIQNWTTQAALILVILGAAAIATLILSIFIHHRFAGPIVRFESHLKSLVAGESPPPIQLRKGDYFQGIAEIINKLPSKNQSGFSLVEVMVVTAIMGITALAFMSLFSVALKQNQQTNTTFNVDLFRKNLTQTIQNSDAWHNTINDGVNTSMTCLKNSTSCTGAGGPFRVMNAANLVEYDPVSSATAGVTATGLSCNTFDAVNGNPTCPFRIALAWQPLCTGACVNPQVQITGTFTYAPGSDDSNSVVFNPIKYNISVIQGVTSPTTSCTMRQNTVVDPGNCGSSVSCNAGEHAVTGGCVNSRCDVSTSFFVMSGTTPTGWSCIGWQNHEFVVNPGSFSSTSYALCCP